MKTTPDDETSSHSQVNYTVSEFQSADGTTIGYRQYGTGPGLVLVQGTMGTAQHFHELAQLLASDFTVYVPDRRGRGMSNSKKTEPGLQHEVDDITTLLEKTHASHLFGLSSGAIISLFTALSTPLVEKLTIYEPPFFVDGVPHALITRYRQEMANDKTAAAMVTAMFAAQFMPPFMKVIPRWLLDRLLAMGLNRETKQPPTEYPTMMSLAPTIDYDFWVIEEANRHITTLSTLDMAVLMLGGSKSPRYFSTALDALEKTLPDAERTTFAGYGHETAWNHDKGGNPEIVANELRQYFSG